MPVLQVGEVWGLQVLRVLAPFQHSGNDSSGAQQMFGASCTLSGAVNDRPSHILALESSIEHYRVTNQAQKAAETVQYLDHKRQRWAAVLAEAVAAPLHQTLLVWGLQ